MTDNEQISYNSLNNAADFWYNKIGVNVIPADSKNKLTYTKWSQWQNTPISLEQFEQWKKEEKFDSGIAIILGKIWRGNYKGKYLVGIDCDNQKAIDECCTIGHEKKITIEQLANQTIVEQHRDQPNKAHIYILSTKLVKKKSSDKVNTDNSEKINGNDIPAIEVKGSGEHGIMCCWPSIHKNGFPYEIIGTKTPVLMDDIEEQIDKILQKYGIPYLDKSNEKTTYEADSDLIPIKELFKPDFVICEGHNRHEAILRAMESLIKRNKEILDLSIIKKLAYEWNQQHCKPPLDDMEFEKQWHDAVNFIDENKKNNKNNQKNSDNDIDTTNRQNSSIDLETNEFNIDSIKEHLSEIFVDQYKEPHAAVYISNHFEILSLKNDRFKNFLYKVYYDYTGKLNSDKIEGMIKTLKAEAEFSGNVKELQLRIAKTDDYTFYYDLTNSTGSMIKITPDGWSIIEKDIPILFKRYTNQKAQVIPSWTMDDKDDVFDKFIDLLNIKDESNKLLLKCYIVSLIIPEIAKPILILHGEQGSAKSTLQELIKMLVDPSEVKTLTFPNSVTELVQMLSHNYVSYFDNISNLPEWISDILCRAVTGSGFTKRALYSNDDDFVYSFKRATGINGINLAATKADLLDRSIIIQLERISRDKRKKINEIWNEFDELKPRLLGYILNIVVKVLQFKHAGKKIQLQELPRMADFAEIGEIIARCMGYQENEFLKAYFDNINIQIDEAIEASPTSIAIIYLLEKNESWIGTATELKTKLDEIAVEDMKISIEKNSSWAKSPNKLSSRLNEIKTNLREKGIEIEKYKENGKRMIKITKASSLPSNRPEIENQIQNDGNIMDDTMNQWTTE